MSRKFFPMVLLLGVSVVSCQNPIEVGARPDSSAKVERRIYRYDPVAGPANITNFSYVDANKCRWALPPHSRCAEALWSLQRHEGRELTPAEIFDHLKDFRRMFKEGMICVDHPAEPSPTATEEVELPHYPRYGRAGNHLDLL